MKYIVCTNEPFNAAPPGKVITKNDNYRTLQYLFVDVSLVMLSLQVKPLTFITFINKKCFIIG